MKFPPLLLRIIKSLSLITMLLISGCSQETKPVQIKSDPDIVNTSYGPVKGIKENGIHAFKGIRYAAPPIGKLRFKPPVPLQPWNEPVTAYEFGNRAMQGPGFGGPDENAQKADEDCLFLNIWTPETDSRKRPVMVWLHGGGFSSGSGADTFCDGHNLSQKGDLVIVTVNHRLNVFGFLQLSDAWGPEYASSGQAGMLDIIMSLKWVKQNIIKFGGDPQNVTIFGESGGGRKVAMLMAMESAKGLFHKAIIQSGSGLDAPSRDKAVKLGQQLLKNLGIKEGDTGTLITADAQLIFDAQPKAVRSAGNTPGQLTVPTGGFVPCVDGTALKRKPFIPDAPDTSADVPLLIGSNKDEESIFRAGASEYGTYTDNDFTDYVKTVLPEKADKLIPAIRSAFPEYSPTDLINIAASLKGYWIATIFQAERKSDQKKAPVYTYLMAWETRADNGRLRAHHALDVPLVFDNADKVRNMTGEGPEPQAMADIMSSAWISFAKTGNPGIIRLPEWPEYKRETRSTMVFDTASQVINDPYSRIRKILISQ